MGEKAVCRKAAAAAAMGMGQVEILSLQKWG